MQHIVIAPASRVSGLEYVAAGAVVRVFDRGQIGLVPVPFERGSASDAFRLAASPVGEVWAECALNAPAGADPRIPGDVQRLHLAPGDTLVVRFGEALSMEQTERIRAHIREQLRDPGAKVLVLDGGAKMSVVSPQAT